MNLNLDGQSYAGETIEIVTLIITNMLFSLKKEHQSFLGLMQDEEGKDCLNYVIVSSKKLKTLKKSTLLFT